MTTVPQIITPQIVSDYAEAFANLQPDTMDELLALVDETVLFVDPFNRVTSKKAFTAIFDHMFETCIDPRFDISDIAYSPQHDGKRAYLRWRMTGTIDGWPHTKLNFEGMTEVHVGDNGLITAHIDHWDSASQLFVTLPIIGALLRPIMKRFVVRVD